MSVYAVALAKGGSTKTTTAAELVAALSARGRRVLALDLDRQGNFSTRMGLSGRSEVKAVAADVLRGSSTVHEAAIPARSLPSVHVVAGTQALADVENLPEISSMLRDYLPTLKAWDDVVIDTPPSLGIVTLAALASADVVIAAVACEGEAYEQLEQLNKFVQQRVSRLRPGADISWVIPTRFDRRRVLDRDVVEMLGEKWPGRVTSPVREAVAARDSYVARETVSEFAPNSGIAADYASVMRQVLRHIDHTEQTNSSEQEGRS